jgi:hypothetical protein
MLDVNLSTLGFVAKRLGIYWKMLVDKMLRIADFYLLDWQSICESKVRTISY